MQPKTRINVTSQFSPMAREGRYGFTTKISISYDIGLQCKILPLISPEGIIIKAKFFHIRHAEKNLIIS